jgi:steroid 5-alpha reductase family enzyme
MSRRLVLGALVGGGLLAAVLAGLKVTDPAWPMPGVALGSSALLVVERALAFFVAWMLVLVVLAEAWRGRLPLEISGRGVRYADAPTSQDMARELGRALERVEEELETHRSAITELQRSVDDPRSTRQGGRI